MTHDEYQEALGLHALGSLEESERRRLESHLEICPSCLRELAALRETGAHLVELAEPLEPSEERFAKILGTLTHEAEEQARVEMAGTLARTGRSLRSVLVRRPFVWGARLSVAAAMAGLVFAVMQLAGQLDRALLEIEHMHEIGAFVTDPGVSVLPLWGTDAARGAHAKLAYEHATGRFMLFSSRIPKPAPGKRYQLWVISDRVRPAAVFSPESPDGKLETPPPEGGQFLFGLSLEPEGESESSEPTGGMVLMSGPVRYPR